MAHSVQTPHSLLDDMGRLSQGWHLQLRVHVFQVPAERLAVQLVTKTYSLRYAKKQKKTGVKLQIRTLNNMFIKERLN